MIYSINSTKTISTITLQAWWEREIERWVFFLSFSYFGCTGKALVIEHRVKSDFGWYDFVSGHSPPHCPHYEKPPKFILFFAISVKGYIMTLLHAFFNSTIPTATLTDRSTTPTYTWSVLYATMINFYSISSF